MLSTYTSNKSQTVTRLLLSAIVLLVAATLFSLPAAAQQTQPTILTSDIVNISVNTDPNLVNPWGMSASSSSPWWVSDNGTGLSTLYNAAGTPQGLVVTIPSANGTDTGTPTGQVFNGTSDFKILGTPAHFLFATEDGTISGWYAGTSAQIVVNNSPGAVYKGLALASAKGANYLYATNFRNNSVDVFDGAFAPHSFGSDAFVDSSIPSGFAPFGIANIGNGKLAVTFAKQDAAKHDDVAGPGNGYVDIFDTSGNLLMRLPHNYYLNSPWAVVVAPATGFGQFSGKILVGQFGSGAIAAFDATTGSFLSLLFDPNRLQLQLNGLWGLGFGNGGSAGPTNTLFFAAGVFGEAHGLFGSITVLTGGTNP
ncbi:MAG: TIGR03118 family protein [Candidatus Korobacteraceae bacterium]